MTSSVPVPRFRNAWLVLGGVLVAAVIVSSLVPGGVPQKFEGMDKIEHASTYMLLMVWFAGLQSRRAWGWVAGALLLMGLLLEVAQGAMHMHRTADVRDMLANAVGVGLGALLAAAGAAAWPHRLETWLARR